MQRLKIMTRTGAAVAAALAVLASGCSQEAKSPAEAQKEHRDRAVEELSAAVQVVNEMHQIPEATRERARCVAVIPSLVNAGFIVGAQHGNGVVSCRTTSGWSAPDFISITGGSAGFQAGAQSSDVVLLVMNDRGMQKLFQSSFTLGADASVAAGPVGAGAQAGTDASMTAAIVSYTRSRGLFAGADVGGSSVKQDQDAQTAMYGTTLSVHDILAGAVPTPKEAEPFIARLSAEFPRGAAVGSVTPGTRGSL